MKRERNNQKCQTLSGGRKSGALILASLLLLSLTSCASMRGVLALPTNDQASGPIHSPFSEVASGKGGSNDSSGGVILRTRKGDRSVEVELPRGEGHALTDLSIPVSAAFRDSNSSRGPASAGGYGASSGMDDSSLNASDSVGSGQLPPPSFTDREIARAFPTAPASEEAKSKAIEQGLGLKPSEDSTPEAQVSYLASLDQIKGLYRQGRFEAALLESDRMVQSYPTDPKLYEMRGTLLDRVGQPELAIQAWQQALRLNPRNESLRKFIERRMQKRSLASP